MGCAPGAKSAINDYLVLYSCCEEYSSFEHRLLISTKSVRDLLIRRFEKLIEKSIIVIFT